MLANPGLPADLQQWLAYIEKQHPQSIALGLERVERVRLAMNLAHDQPVFTVGGTNGKGSICAFLAAILEAAGYRVGVYTSPHLLRYNERVRLAGREADDAELAAAFARVESARLGCGGNTRLTYFEYGTLAAIDLFVRERMDVLVLEVGMGGRLDAVNVLDADCAVVSSVGLDHMDYLGSTRAAIGYEKAGILRAGRPAIIAEPDPPQTLLAHAHAIGARLQRFGVDFSYAKQGDRWRYSSTVTTRSDLPPPALNGDRQFRNASAALAAVDAVAERLPVSESAIRAGLRSVRLAGRFQILPGAPALILDVGHNPEAADVLAQNLGALKGGGRTLAVFGMLKDKDIAAVAQALMPHVDQWFASTLPPPRGASSEDLARLLRAAGAREVRACENPRQAYDAALGAAGGNDRILVFGSFYTVADVMAACRRV